MEKVKEFHVHNPVRPRKSIGRRTGKPIRKKKNTDNDTDSFSDYLSDSGEEKSINVTTYTPLAATENIEPCDKTNDAASRSSVEKVSTDLFHHGAAGDVMRGRFVNPLVPSSRYGRRTGKDLLAGKKSKILCNGMENFSDFLSDSSDVSMSVHATPSVSSVKSSTSAKESDVDSSPKAAEDLENEQDNLDDEKAARDTSSLAENRIVAPDCDTGTAQSCRTGHDKSTSNYTAEMVTTEPISNNKNISLSPNDISHRTQQTAELSKNIEEIGTRSKSYLSEKDIEDEHQEGDNPVSNKSHGEKETLAEEHRKQISKLDISEKKVDSEEEEVCSPAEYVISNAGLDNDESCASDERANTNDADTAAVVEHQRAVTKGVKAQSKIPVFKFKGSTVSSHCVSHNLETSILPALNSSKSLKSLTETTSSSSETETHSEEQQSEQGSENPIEKLQRKLSVSHRSSHFSHTESEDTMEKTSAYGEPSQTNNDVRKAFKSPARTAKSTTSNLDFGGDVTGSVSNAEKAQSSHFFGIKKRLSYSVALAGSAEKEEEEAIKPTNHRQPEETALSRKSIGSFLDHHETVKVGISNTVAQNKPMVSLASRRGSQAISQSSEGKSDLNISTVSSGEFCIVEEEEEVVAPKTLKVIKSTKKTQVSKAGTRKSDRSVNVSTSPSVVDEKDSNMRTLEAHTKNTKRDVENILEPRKSSKRKNISVPNEDDVFQAEEAGKAARNKRNVILATDELQLSENDKSSIEDGKSRRGNHVEDNLSSSEKGKRVKGRKTARTKVLREKNRSVHVQDHSTTAVEAGKSFHEFESSNKRRGQKVQHISNKKTKQDIVVNNDTLNTRKNKGGRNMSIKEDMETSESPAVQNGNLGDNSGSTEIVNTEIEQPKLRSRQKVEPVQYSSKRKLKEKQNAKPVRATAVKSKSQTVREARRNHRGHRMGNGRINTRMQTRAAPRNTVSKMGNQSIEVTKDSTTVFETGNIQDAELGTRPDREDQVDKNVPDMDSDLCQQDKDQGHEEVSFMNACSEQTNGETKQLNSTEVEKANIDIMLNPCPDTAHRWDEGNVGVKKHNKIAATEFVSGTESQQSQDEMLLRDCSGNEFEDHSITKESSNIRQKGTTARSGKQKLKKSSRETSVTTDGKENDLGNHQPSSQKEIEMDQNITETADYTAPLKTSSHRKRNSRKRNVLSEKRKSSKMTASKWGTATSQETDNEESTPVKLHLLSALPNLTPQSGVSFRRSRCFTSSRVQIDDVHSLSLDKTPPKAVRTKREDTPKEMASCLRDVGSTKHQRKGRRVRISNIISHREVTPSQSDSNSTTLLSPSAPPVHYAETTLNIPPSKSPKIALPDLSHKIVRPDGDAVTGLRRSNRTRVKRLNSFKGEEIVYRRDSTGFGLLIDRIQPSMGEAKVKALEEQRRKKLKQRKLKSMAVPAKPKRRLSTHWKLEQDLTIATEIPLINPDTQEEVTADLIAHRNSATWVGPDMAPVTGTEPIAACLLLQQPGFTTGEIHMRPLAEKPSEQTAQTLIFNVLHGKICLTVNEVSTMVETGDDFFIPRGTWYMMKNLRRDIAKLHFLDFGDSASGDSADLEGKSPAVWNS